MDNVKVNGADLGLGAIVFWTVPTLILHQDQVVELLRKHNLSEKSIDFPTDKIEVSRAVYSFQNLQKRENRKLAERIGTNEAETIYGILSHVNRGDDAVGYEQDTTIKVNKEDGSVTANGPLAADFNLALEKFRDSIVDDDIRTFLRGVIKQAHGIAIRPTGGVYFIHQNFLPLLENVSAFLKEIGAKLYISHLINDEAAQEMVKDSAIRAIEDEIETFLDRVNATAKRAGCLRKQEGAIEEIEELTNLYAQVLGNESLFEDCRKKLNDASNVLATKLVELTTAAPIKTAGTPRISYSDFIVKALDADKTRSFNAVAIENMVKANPATVGIEIPKSVPGILYSLAKFNKIKNVSRGQYASNGYAPVTVVPPVTAEVAVENTAVVA